MSAVPPTIAATLLPRAGRLAAWGTAFLAGATSLDEADLRTVGSDLPHRVVGLPGEEGELSVSLALASLRRSGVTALRPALPVPGDATGLPGPPSFNVSAMDAGECVLTVGGLPLGTGIGLVPVVTAHAGGEAVLWVAHATTPTTDAGGVPTLSEAERGLAEALRRATAELESLGLEGGRDEVAGVLRAAARQAGHAELPSTLHGRPARVLEQATRLALVVDVARLHPGATVGLGEQRAREAALAPLATAVRHALIAAYGAGAEPASSPTG